MKTRISKKLSANYGLHATYIPFNNTYSIEPRGALTLKTNSNKEWNLAAGMHSKPEHVSTFFLNKIVDDVSQELEANKDLEIPKSVHLVAGHKFPLGENTLASVELYYQYHFDIPVEQNDSSIFSTAIVSQIWDIVGRDKLVSQGKARNYGIDLSVQRTLANNYYYMLNTSIYKAEYSNFKEDWFNSRYNGDYVTNLTAGKEWKLKNPAKSLGLNTKILASGGNRIVPIDLNASIAQGEEVLLLDQAFEEHAGNYLRWDLSISYKVNRKNTTHTILFDVQNVTGKQNIYTKYFDDESLQLETVNQLGIFPFFNYRIEFQGK